MPRPSHIILIRHGESEGNIDRTLFQTKPDHRHRLTDRGIQQAAAAGRNLREMLEDGDSLQFYVSPYQRTRDTFRHLMRGLTEKESAGDTQGEGKSWDGKVTYFEEPRLREQDWGNFQLDEQRMRELRAERERYGHFFYRIPNGESGADVYDRLSTFIDTLHRAFDRHDFPQKCVIVTHGLLIRLFLTRWYHYRYDEYEEMENLRHCELVTMHLDHATSKYHLMTPLRRWPSTTPPGDLSMCGFENESWAHMLHDEGNQEQPQRGRGRHWWEQIEEVVSTETGQEEERPGSAGSDDSETWGG